MRWLRMLTQDVIRLWQQELAITTTQREKERDIVVGLQRINPSLHTWMHIAVQWCESDTHLSTEMWSDDSSSNIQWVGGGQDSTGLNASSLHCEGILWLCQSDRVPANQFKVVFSNYLHPMILCSFYPVGVVSSRTTVSSITGLCQVSERLKEIYTSQVLQPS